MHEPITFHVFWIVSGREVLNPYTRMSVKTGLRA